MLHRISQIFQPRLLVPLGKESSNQSTSVSQKLLNELGLVATSSTGTNILLPIVHRSLEKLKKSLRRELNKINAQEILMPLLTPITLLKKTDRHELPELFKLLDRHSKEYVLSPTHEEVVSHLVASLSKPSYKFFPLILYQIGNKFRDEMKPKFGLIRSREFLMKDLYTFDVSADMAIKSYDLIKESYSRFFDLLEVTYACVEGCPGEIGGSMSHEFHVVSNIGEDKLSICNDCKFGRNFQNEEIISCKKCGSNNTKFTFGIEVGHSFFLGTKYSKPLQAVYHNQHNEKDYLHMTCHGIGLTRLLAAVLEVKSTQNELRWPKGISPYYVCLIPPKKGSREEASRVDFEAFSHQLALAFDDEVVIDDRTELTIGKRFIEARRMGFPFIVVVGKSSLLDTPKIEVFDTLQNATCEISPNDVIPLLKKNFN